MGMIPRETIERILEATDIVDLIGGYFPLKRSGSDFKINCPFHGEKTPSFNINPARQRYKCFGCDASGSALNFLMEYENLPFVDAVRKLADRAGIQIIEEASDPESDRKRRKISRLKELNNKSARFFHEQLLKNPDAAHAREYLKSRGFGKETAQKWLIGWAPRNSNLFLQMARENSFNGREILQAGLGGLKDKNNPRSGLWVKFYDQITFPIHNDVDDVVGFSARILREDDKRGKYINTNETPLFNKSKLLFALNKARRPMGKEKFALLCEGQVDAIVLHESGFENTIAPLGTAFTEQHARMIKRYTDRVVLCYDGDNAGLAAADKTFKQLTAQGLPVRLMHLPDGDDPDTFVKKYGAEAFQKLLGSAKEYFDAKLDKELKVIDLSSAAEKTKLLQELAKSVCVMDDDLLRDATIQNLAIRLRLGVEDFRQTVAAAKADLKRFRPREDQEEKADKVEPTAIDHFIIYLCHLALNSEAAAEYLSEQLETLQECLGETLGNHVLIDILEKRPNPESEAAKQAYLMTIPKGDRIALENGFSETIPEDPVSSACDTIAMLSARFYQIKEKALRTRLNDPGLTQEEILDAFEEAKRLQSILKELDQRF
ncbi:MAG TPA: DNA primase [Verrucomicrobiales bacterium]|nr:DNA primase [Verrucomicrobiales bacterium]|tara:strand:+ start:998 stop:2809 length:1812 start_codon:yes stop_codon:yes gene_type:complete